MKISLHFPFSVSSNTSRTSG